MLEENIKQIPGLTGHIINLDHPRYMKLLTKIYSRSVTVDSVKFGMAFLGCLDTNPDEIFLVRIEEFARNNSIVRTVLQQSLSIKFDEEDNSYPSMFFYKADLLEHRIDLNNVSYEFFNTKAKSLLNLDFIAREFNELKYRLAKYSFELLTTDQVKNLLMIASPQDIRKALIENPKLQLDKKNEVENKISATLQTAHQSKPTNTKDNNSRSLPQLKPRIVGWNDYHVELDFQDYLPLLANFKYNTAFIISFRDREEYRINEYKEDDYYLVQLHHQHCKPTSGTLADNVPDKCAYVGKLSIVRNDTNVLLNVYKCSEISGKRHDCDNAMLMEFEPMSISEDNLYATYTSLNDLASSLVSNKIQLLTGEELSMHINAAKYLQSMTDMFML